MHNSLTLLFNSIFLSLFSLFMLLSCLHCIAEGLRMYPPLPDLLRRCTEDYVIPDTNITIEKGTSVIIPILGLHYDEDFFPEPDKFNPDRFHEENIGNVKPYTYLPFGDGPRNCLGKNENTLHFLLLLNHSFFRS